MASAGVPMRALQALMGHSNIETTEIYADYAPDPNRGGSMGGGRLPRRMNWCRLVPADNLGQRPHNAKTPP